MMTGKPLPKIEITIGDGQISGQCIPDGPELKATAGSVASSSAASSAGSAVLL